MATALFSSVRRLAGKLAAAITGVDDDPRVTGAEEDFLLLDRTLRRIQAVLSDAEEREVRDRAVHLWLDELTAIACAAEDVLDSFHYDLLASAAAAPEPVPRKRRREEPAGDGASCSYATTRKTRLYDATTVGKIRRIRERFEEISRDRDALCLREEDAERRTSASASASASAAQASISQVEEASIVGREDDKEEIVRLLVSEEHGAKFAVIPIVGMGGLGKTTVAQLAYNDPRVRRHFHRRAWVSVSESFDVARLTRAAVESITEEPCNFAELSMLQDVLAKELEGKRFLLVLDDVWNEKRSLWDRFRAPLAGAETVRVLVTSRIASASKIMQTVPPHRLHCLPAEQSWMLFRKHAFQCRALEEDAELVEIGRKIVNKCGGLPLALKALGGLLRYEMDEAKWREVLESEIWEVDGENNEILPALQLSYTRMPWHLKPCFLYFAMFPKESELQKDRMVRLWMAQGYILSGSERRLEDVGREYLDELHGRSLLDCFSKYNEEMYRMHALIHDLADSVVARRRRYMMHDAVQSDVSYKANHLYLGRKKVLQDFLSHNNPMSLRTLLNYDLHSHLTGCPAISMMARLRALELDIYGVDELPDAIGCLKHLRFLSVAGPRLRRLPESACVLYNLQTLDLQRCFLLRELPRGIGNLINLRFLRLHTGEIKRLPESLCRLCNLQTLDLKCCYGLAELPSGIEQLASLQILDISHTAIHCLPQGIGMLTALQNLTATLNATRLSELKDLTRLGAMLCISGLENIVDVQHSREVNLRSKRNLRKLNLKWRRSDINHHEPNDGEDGDGNGSDEGQLHLKVGSNNARKDEINEDLEEAVFQSLQPHSNVTKLSVDGFAGKKYPSWLGDPSYLSKLTTLVLKNICGKGPSVLPPLGELRSLESLSIINVGVKKIGEEFCRHSDSVDTASSFPKRNAFSSLKRLEFRDLQDWHSWSGVLNGDFCRLRELLVKECPKICMLPAFPSLHSLCLYACERLISAPLVPSDGNPSALQVLSIKGCPHLVMSDLKNLHELVTFQLSEWTHNELVLPPSAKLQYLLISWCWQLLQIPGLHDLDNIATLHVSCCPQLQLPLNEVMQSSPRKVEIVDCLKLQMWCQRNKFDYLQKLPALEELILSDNRQMPSYLLGHGMQGIEYVCIKNCSEEEMPAGCGISYQFFSSVLRSFYTELPKLITTLKMSNFTKAISVTGLYNLTSLKHLRLLDCPQLRHWQDNCLPSTLETLVIENCEQLAYIPPLNTNSCTLDELQIWNCPKLTGIVALDSSTSLKTLMVIQCRKVWASPAETLQAVLQNVVIRDCPRMKAWCERNSIPYIQWFDDSIWC